MGRHKYKHKLRKCKANPLCSCGDSCVTVSKFRIKSHHRWRGGNTVGCVNGEKGADFFWDQLESQWKKKGDSRREEQHRFGKVCAKIWWERMRHDQSCNWKWDLMTAGARDGGRHGGVRRKGGEGDDGKWEVLADWGWKKETFNERWLMKSRGSVLRIFFYRGGPDGTSGNLGVGHQNQKPKLNIRNSIIFLFWFRD